MTEETGFLDGQAVQQGRPLHCATRTVGHLAVVAVVVADAQFTHARGQAGLQERPALLVEHHAGAVLNRTCQSRNSAADISASGCSDQTPFACMPCPSSKVSTRRPPGGRRAYAQACSTPSGSLKPDTELRISLAIFARLPMLRAVAVVPAEVCEVIS